MINIEDKFNLFNKQKLCTEPISLNYEKTPQSYIKIRMYHKEYLTLINDKIKTEIVNYIDNTIETDIKTIISEIISLVNNITNNDKEIYTYITDKQSIINSHEEMIYNCLKNSDKIIKLIEPTLDNFTIKHVKINTKSIYGKLLSLYVVEYCINKCKNHILNLKNLVTSDFISIIYGILNTFNYTDKKSVVFNNLDFRDLFQMSNAEDIRSLVNRNTFIKELLIRQLCKVIKNYDSPKTYDEEKIKEFIEFINMCSKISSYLVLIKKTTDTVKEIKEKFSEATLNLIYKYITNNDISVEHWTAILPYIKDYNNYILDNWKDTEEYIDIIKPKIIAYGKMYKITALNDKITNMKNNILLNKELYNLSVNIKQKYAKLHDFNTDNVKINPKIMNVDITYVDVLKTVEKYNLNQTLTAYENVFNVFYKEKYPERDFSISHMKSVATITYNNYQITGPLICINILMIIYESSNATIEYIMRELTTDNTIDEISDIIIKMQKLDYIKYQNHKYHIGNFSCDTVIDINKKTREVKNEPEKDFTVIVSCYVMKVLKQNSTKFFTINEITNEIYNKYPDISCDEVSVEFSCNHLSHQKTIQMKNETYCYKL